LASNFEKRQKKSPEIVAAEIQEKRSELRSKAEATYSQTALDIYSSDGGKNYEVAEIAFNPETGEAKVVATYSVSRLVALTGINQKTALNTLKRKLIKKDGN
jgi:hypothetical protein